MAKIERSELEGLSQTTDELQFWKVLFLINFNEIQLNK